MDQSTFQNIVLLLLIALSLLMTGMVIRAFIVERREGLSISSNRLYMALTCTVLLGAVAFFNFRAGMSPAPIAAPPPVAVPSSPTNPVPPTVISPSVQHQIDSLERRKRELEAERAPIESQITVISQKIAQLKPNDPNASGKQDEKVVAVQKPVNSASTPWLVFIGLALFVFQMLAMLFIDDPRSLLIGWRQRRRQKNSEKEKQYQEALDKLDRLAEAAQLGDYQRGIELAEQIEPWLLSTLEQIDRYYLKSFCAVQTLLRRYTTAESGFPTTADKKMIAETGKELNTLLGLAPRLSEAEYLSGILGMLQGDYKNAIEKFDTAQSDLSQEDADFHHFISTCCLHLAAQMLAEAESSGADQLFDRVISIGVAADKVPAILLENRLLQVRQHYANKEYGAARQALEAVHQVTGLTEEQRQSLDVISGSVNVLLLDAENKHAEALAATRDFLKKWTPAELPEPDDHAAEEFLFPIVQEESLPFAAEVFRGFYFLDAILQVQAQQGRHLNSEQVDSVARALLRALQFAPRHREILAALGLLYFYGKAEKRTKSLEWLEAALSMGVFHPMVVALVEKEKGKEDRRSKLLDRFMSLALERLFSRDISDNMRKELLDEWGQFKDFHPALQEIQSVQKPEYAPLTLQAILNRAKYVQSFAAEVVSKEISEPSAHFKQAQEKYEYLARLFQHQMQELTELEKQIMQEIGKQVLR